MATYEREEIMFLLNITEKENGRNTENLHRRRPQGIYQHKTDVYQMLSVQLQKLLN